MKRTRLNSYLFVLMCALVLFCGCTRREEKIETMTLPYDLNRPEWIYKGGIEGIPDEIMGKVAQSVSVCGDSVWYGVYGYGLAEYQTKQMKWNLFPLEIREVVVASISCSEDMVYAGISGHGILEFNPETQKKTMYRNGDESITNRYFEIIYLKNRVWASTDSGLYVLDLATGDFSLIDKAGLIYTTKIGDTIVVALPWNVDRSLVFYNAVTAEIEKRIPIVDEIEQYSFILYAHQGFEWVSTT